MAPVGTTTSGTVLPKRADLKESNRGAPRQVEVNVSGRGGRDGADGSRGSDGCGSGGDGHDGQDAGRASEGQRGGSIAVDLGVSEFEDGSAQVRAKVDSVDPSGGQQQSEELLPQGSTIWLDARGGAGGDGGTGGAGGDGRRGADGHDATRYSSGGNGERGGDGGDGGRGTSGADGGDGGRVTLRVPAGDIDALAAVRATLVDGGPGGRAGQHGRGGDGASGGSGGSSYSWTERDREGRTEYHSNPGGMSGSSGHDGRTPTDPLYRGDAGRDGEVSIEVIEQNGSVSRYGERYRMEVQSDHVTDTNHDSIYEPGEKLAIDVELANVGPMVSPSQPMTERITPNTDVQVADGAEAPLPPSLEPGARTKIEGLKLALTPDAKTHRGEPLNIAATIDTVARATRPGVDLPESMHQTPIQIRYPVEISAIDGDRTATLERPAAVSWKVTNISTQPVGDESECRRVLESFLKMTGGDVAAEYLTFTGPDGVAVPLTQGLGAALATLAPGESTELKGTISFSKDAPPYSNVQLTALLDFGALDKPEQARAVQARDFSVQLARTYAKDASAGLLLVVNNRTTKEEIRAWEDLSRDFGFKSNVWNLSLYGAVSLTDAIADHELGEDFAGKTAIVLNNEFDPEAGSASPLGHLADKELLVAACQQQMSTYVVAGDVDIRSRLQPQIEGEATTYYDRYQYHDAVYLHRAGSEAPLGRDEVPVDAFGRPSEEKLAKRAREIEKHLRAENPDRRYTVTVDFKPGEKDESFFAPLKWHDLGTVRVSRSADVSRRTVMHLRAEDPHDPGFVAGTANRYAFCKALTLPQKLQAFDFLLEKNTDRSREDLQVLTQALLSDVAEEQQAMRLQTWRGEVDRNEIREKLWRTRAVADHFAKVSTEDADHQGAVPLESPRGQLVIELAAQIGHMTEQARSFADHVLPLRRRTSLDHVSDECVKDLIKNAFEGDSYKEAKQAVKARREALELADAQKPKEEKLGMTAYLRPASWSESMRSDFDVWDEARQSRD